MKAYNSNKDKTGLCFLLLCAVSLVCSCSVEDPLTDLGGSSPFVSSGVEVAFSGGFVREGWDGRDDSGRAGTRVSDQTWTVGDAVGIYMVPNSSYALTGAMWKNHKWVVTDSDAGAMTPDNEADKLYFPDDATKRVRFVAYCPYTADASETATLNKVSVDFTDQSTQAKKMAKDFVFHRGTTDYNRNSSTVSLKNFSHKFSKIWINVTKGDGGPSLSGLTVTLGNMPQSATVDLDKMAQQQSGDITAGTQAATITAYTLSSSETSATVEAIVAPHMGFTNRTFTFTASDGSSRVYALPDDVEFQSGMSYTYTLTLVAVTVPDPPEKPFSAFDGMTNCYMVKPGERVVFPVSRAYVYEYTQQTFSKKLRVAPGDEYTGRFGVETVWQDVANLVVPSIAEGSGNETMVRVVAGNASGNAVVKIYKKDDANKTPVWSYHIWVTDYDPTINTWTNPYQTAHTYTFMDRNLGATEAANSLAGRGLLYQWGRKDPFPGGKSGTAGFAALDKFYGIDQSGAGSTTAVTVFSDYNTGAIVESIQKPTTFFKYKNTDYFNWLPTLDNNLWSTNGTASGNKTIYDPCPSGWRVPARVNISTSSDDSPWKGLAGQNFTESDTGGVNWDDNALFPTAGYRGYSSGSITDEGLGGIYWIASPYGGSSDTHKVSYMSFNYSGDISQNLGYNRGYGFSVRCVKE